MKGFAVDIAISYFCNVQGSPEYMIPYFSLDLTEKILKQCKNVARVVLIWAVINPFNIYDLIPQPQPSSWLQDSQSVVSLI